MPRIRAHAGNEFFIELVRQAESPRLVFSATTKEAAFASFNFDGNEDDENEERTMRDEHRVEDDSVSIAITGAQPRTNSHHGQNEPQFLPGENAEQSWTDVVPWNADRRSYGLSSLRPSSFLPVLEPTTPETRRSRNELAWYLVDGCPYFSLWSNGSHLFFSKFFEPMPVESISGKVEGSLFRLIITINLVYKEFFFNAIGINYESLFFMRLGISRKFCRVKDPSIWSISSIQPLENAQIVEILWPSG